MEQKERKRGKKAWLPLALGAAYGGLILILAYCAVFHAKIVFKPLVYLMGVGENWQMLAGVLEQLEKADVSFSYIPALVGAVGGGVWLAKSSEKAKPGRGWIPCSVFLLFGYRNA